MLAIDTNLRELSSASGDAGPLKHNEVLGIPLRSAREYRAHSRRFLQWMSRRWLYNIPRSLQTEGIRPLGRLALVDHFDEVAERLGVALEACTDSDCLSQTLEQTNLPFLPNALQVFLVGSISGGTGGGMILDLGHLAQKLVRKLDLSSVRISAMLAHSTPRQASHRDLASANAYSFLSELMHFDQPGNHYPGDPAIGMEPASSGTRTFDDTYLVHLGEEINDAAYEGSADALGEYLFRIAATPAAGFFDHYRDAAQRSETAMYDAPRINTLGMTCWSEKESGDPYRDSQMFRIAIHDGHPRLQAGQGDVSVLATCPSGALAAERAELVQAEFMAEPTVLRDEHSGAWLCCQHGRVPLEAVAAKLIDHRPDYAEIASRLHTRVDVAWSQL